MKIGFCSFGCPAHLPSGSVEQRELALVVYSAAVLLGPGATSTLQHHSSHSEGFTV